MNYYLAQPDEEFKLFQDFMFSKTGLVHELFYSDVDSPLHGDLLHKNERLYGYKDNYKKWTIAWAEIFLSAMETLNE